MNYLFFKKKFRDKQKYNINLIYKMDSNKSQSIKSQINQLNKLREQSKVGTTKFEEKQTSLYSELEKKLDRPLGGKKRKSRKSKKGGKSRKAKKSRRKK